MTPQPEKPRPSESLSNPRMSRRGFLRRVGKTIAVAEAMMNAGPIIQAASPLVNAIGNELVHSAEAQTIPAVFSNLASPDQVRARQELEANPPETPSMFVEKDQSNNVQAIHLLITDQDGNYLYVYSRLNAQAGKMTGWILPSRNPLPLKAQSIAAIGPKVSIGGENSNQDQPVNLFSGNGGSVFTPVDLKTTSGWINEQDTLPEKNKFILNIRGTNTTGSLGILDSNTMNVVQILWNGGITRDSITLIPLRIDSNQAIVYAPAIGPGTETGYLKVNISNLNKGQATSELKHRQLGTADAFCVQKNPDGTASKIMFANKNSQTLTILDAASDNVLTSIRYADLLDNANIPNYDQGSLYVSSVHMIGNYVWLGATYQNTSDHLSRVVFLAWPLGSNPMLSRRYHKIQENHDSSISKQKDMVWGKFNNLPGWLANIEYLGPTFIETAQDGAPLDSPTILYLNDPRKASVAGIRLYMGQAGLRDPR